MDIWDVARLMWRRWLVTVPMLLLTALAVGGVWASASPDYRATGHVAVVGPSVQRLGSQGELRQVNPWSSEALADAAVIRLQGRTLAEELAAEGFTGEWSVQVTGRLPVIRLEVVADRLERAQATLQRLREAIVQEVQERQAESTVTSEQQIATVSYDGGESIERVTTPLKRALVVVTGAGLIATVGVVVAFDAWTRRTRRASEPTPVTPAPSRLNGDSAGHGGSGDKPEPGAAPDSGPSPDGGGARAGVRVRYRVLEGSAGPPEPSSSTEPDADPTTGGGDTTMHLPRANGTAPSA